MGRAFGEYVTRYPADQLPKAGGLNATLIVTVTLDSLLGGLKAAQLDTGQTISAALARKLACEAGIIPADPRRPVPRVGPGSEEEVPQPRPAGRGHPRTTRLHRRRLRHPTRDVPSPPPHPLESGWGHRPRRPHALPQTPPHRPQPGVRDGQAPRREGRLQPANLKPTPAPMNGTPRRDGRDATIPDTALPRAPGFRDGRCATSSTTGAHA